MTIESTQIELSNAWFENGNYSFCIEVVDVNFSLKQEYTQISKMNINMQIRIPPLAIISLQLIIQT